MSAKRFSTLGTMTCAIAAAVGALAFTSAVPAQAAEEPLFAILNGENECNAVNPPNGPVCQKGDPDAFGSATILFPTGNRLCFSIIVTGIAPAANAAHIHTGIATENGGVFVTLTPPTAPFASNPGASSGCVAIAPANAAQIINNPTGFYVNVHNTAFPSGALRGQLF